MYGKIFSSTFSGSMFGAGAEVFAVWSYVIANTVDSRVELNPAVLAATIGASEASMTRAIEALCAPDPSSRNPAEDGRRLVREGQFQYRVVSHEIYRKIQSEDNRREYNKMKQRESRARRKQSKGVSLTGQTMSPPSLQAEADTEEEKECGVAKATPEAQAPPPSPEPKRAGKPVVKVTKQKAAPAPRPKPSPNDLLATEERRLAYWRLVETFGGAPKNPRPRETAAEYDRVVDEGTDPAAVQAAATRALEFYRGEARYMPQLLAWLTQRAWRGGDLPPASPAAPGSASVPAGGLTTREDSLRSDWQRKAIPQLSGMRGAWEAYLAWCRSEGQAEEQARQKALSELCCAALGADLEQVLAEVEVDGRTPYEVQHGRFLAVADACGLFRP